MALSRPLHSMRLQHINQCVEMAMHFGLTYAFRQCEQFRNLPIWHGDECSGQYSVASLGCRLIKEADSMHVERGRRRTHLPMNGSFNFLPMT